MFEVVGDGSDFSAVEEQRETRLLINALFGRAWSGRYLNHAFQSASLYPGRKRRRIAAHVARRVRLHGFSRLVLLETL